MRRFLLLLLLLPAPALAQQATTNSNQNNDNQAASQSMANQQNQSRSESVGGNLNNYQINNSQGDLGEMMIGPKGVSCQSPSFYVSAGVLPQDYFGFYTFEDRNREMMYAPQAQLGFQMPFGPQVAACVAAMKNQAQQIELATAAGTVQKCVQLKDLAKKTNVSLNTISANFPVLQKACSGLWGVQSIAQR
jgi:hypothetical protein